MDRFRGISFNGEVIEESTAKEFAVLSKGFPWLS